MIFHGFIHSESGDINDSLFRSNVIQFVNDKDTHPLIKYQAFIVALILIVSGLLILLLFNGERIFNHPYWKHLFIPISSKTDDDYMSDAAIFRKAVEGMSSSSSSSSSKEDNSESQAAQKSKKSACGTDCGKYIDLKRKINDLSKYVDAVHEQNENIKKTDEKIKELGKKIEDMNKSLSPGGQLNIQI
jgi:hypothetical protein